MDRSDEGAGVQLLFVFPLANGSSNFSYFKIQFNECTSYIYITTGQVASVELL